MVTLNERARPSLDAQAHRDGLRTLAGHMWWSDFAVIALAVVSAQIARFGFGGAEASASLADETLSVSYVLVTVLIGVGWMWALRLFSTRARRVLGSSDDEYKLVFRATVALFSIVAIVAYVLQLDIARGYVAVAFPLGLVLLLLSRVAWRRWLRAEYAGGRLGTGTVLVGSASSVERIAAVLRNDRASGFVMLGAFVPGGASGERLESGLEVLGDIDDSVAMAGDADRVETVIVTGSDALAAEDVRRISWALRPGSQHLVVAPSLIDVGGPRLHVRPIAGLPLMHVETPRYRGTQAALKRLFDVAFSGALLLLLSVPLALVALAIKLTSPGPVLFTQERVGLHGRPFRMLKLRSMVVDAEDRLETLLDAQHREGNEVLFKMKDDPRVTAVGRLLRRYSIDELPQLINVLTGSMSIVGPRPPLAREVAQYEDHVRRRFLVKPGLTGLWQVSGRSNLSWEESVRLDLYYVENWSFVADLSILARTARAVFAREGAY